jgi:hypothetical protein
MKKGSLMLFIAILITILSASSAKAQYCVQDGGGVFVGGGVFMLINNARFFSNRTDLASFLSTGTFGGWSYPVSSCQAWGKAQCTGNTSPYITCTAGQRKVFAVSQFIHSVDFDATAPIQNPFALVTTIVCVDPTVTP